MFGRIALALFGIATLASGQDAPSRLAFEDLLRAVSDLDALTRPPVAGESCVQFSSYDRRSDAGPADPEAWFANGDAGQFVRTIEHDGRTEHVMVDVAGPGAVVRIWSANPSGNLFFYFDGEETPSWQVDFGALLRGELPGLGEPLCGTRSRGGNCHLPIPFRTRLVVTSDASKFYYQVNVRRFPESTATDRFDPDWIDSRRAEIAAAAARLASGGEDLTLRDGVAHQRGAVFCEASATGAVWSHTLRGPGVLRGLRLRAVPVHSKDADVLPALLRTLRVNVRCDGETTVDVPFADFFASAPAFLPWRGLALGVTEDGVGYCDFPMPCEQQLELAVCADASLPCDLRLDWESGFAAGEVPGDSLRFRASWCLDKDRKTRPFGDHLVLDATGAGRYVGTAVAVRNPTKAWWGEGDEKITVDGEAFPSTFGTGTEDYFGYAWCCPDRFDHPLHAQPQCDGPANFGYTANVRLHVPDHVPFRERLRFDLELWHWHDVVVDYASTAYWYGTKGARSGLPPLPEVTDRLPVEMTPPASFIAENAIEAESLQVLGCTAGSVQRQDMNSFTNGQWSRGAQLWWIDGAPGARLQLALAVAAAGRYRVEGAFTRARDYGIVKVRIGDAELGDAIDLYAPAVTATGAQVLGTVELTAGDSVLELEIVGHNAKAVPSHLVGVDYLRLTPVDDER